MKKNNLVVICLVIAIVMVLVIPFSKAVFKSLGNSTSTIATADWDVSLNQTGLSDEVVLTSGVDTQTYTLKVRSNSEVNVEYAIEIGNVPSGVKIKLDERANYESPDENNVVRFSDAGTILYSSEEKENTHVLTFTSEVGTSAVADRQLTVKVIVQQEI